MNMYLEHFSLKERPFSISPDPRFLFMSNRYREALTHLTYGVKEGGGFVLLTGEVGTGKTTVCRCLLQQLPENTRLAFVLNPKLDSIELLATICDELDVEYPEGCQSLKTLTDKLTEYLVDCYRKGLTVVVMIDEAQNLETEVLEQIRLLTNLETDQKKLLQIILVGQPELQEKLARRELRQLAQRITARYHLRPLNLKETIAYILHRTRIAGARKTLFSRDSIEHLHAKTQGIPRLINTICDRALLAAATRGMHQVSRNLMLIAVKEIMGDLDGEQFSLHKKEKLKWMLPVAASFSIVALLGFSYWLGSHSNDTSLSTEIIEPSKAQKDIVNHSDESVLSVDKNNNDEFEQKAQKVRFNLVDRIVGNQVWDNSGRRAFELLMSLWQLEYVALENGEPCAFAETYGLYCRYEKGNWQQLRDYNRPALLRFSAGLQGEFWGLLKELNGTQAVIVVGGNETSVRLDELSMIWTGEYQFLWQAPIGYQGDIKLGDQGDAVFWLSQSLSWLDDSEQQPQQTFDKRLQNRLIDFQSKQNIHADGIAGMQTILKLNAETMVGIPLLSQIN
ncbi:ExeA family protein [Aliikangiella sp. G2MR2-5]|uniref:ExeA family protein n=1 Tax=Aliikangiella sp. G2MR2-5 TaxID=2788943 RepID=UPI0018A8FC5E|nr:ExeA family protein [Aliikangiella sp. G2MR2-5]